MVAFTIVIALLSVSHLATALWNNASARRAEAEKRRDELAAEQTFRRQEEASAEFVWNLRCLIDEFTAPLEAAGREVPAEWRKYVEKIKHRAKETGQWDRALELVREKASNDATYRYAAATLMEAQVGSIKSPADLMGERPVSSFAAARKPRLVVNNH